MYVCAVLDGSGGCSSWVPLPSWLPDLSITDAQSIATAVGVLFAIVFAWKVLRRFF